MKKQNRLYSCNCNSIYYKELYAKSVKEAKQVFLEYLTYLISIGYDISENDLQKVSINR